MILAANLYGFKPRLLTENAVSDLTECINRKRGVKIDIHHSGVENFTYGVHQECVLGSTLFLVYINELCKLSLSNIQIYAFADDTAIVVYGQN